MTLGTGILLAFLAIGIARAALGHTRIPETRNCYACFFGFLLALTAAGCSADDRLAILDQSFTLKPGEKDTWTFIVYSEGPCFVDASVDVAGGAADVAIVREEPASECFAAPGVVGKKSFSGNLDGGAYRITVTNVSAAPVKIHVLVYKDLEARR